VAQRTRDRADVMVHMADVLVATLTPEQRTALVGMLEEKAEAKRGKAVAKSNAEEPAGVAQQTLIAGRAAGFRAGYVGGWGGGYAASRSVAYGGAYGARYALAGGYGPGIW
jgi:hypothetical protein